MPPEPTSCKIEAFAKRLQSLDGSSYGAYKSLSGPVDYGAFTLNILYIQGDPFAAPSRIELAIPLSTISPPDWALVNAIRKEAFCDFLHREVAHFCPKLSTHQGSGKGGEIRIVTPSQKILARTAVQLKSDVLSVRLSIGLPARGRRIMGRAAASIFAEAIPELVESSLIYGNDFEDDLRLHVETAEDTDALRAQLKDKGLVAFIADGALLPRRSGIDDRPMAKADARLYQSPQSLRVDCSCPNKGTLTGTGIREGITLIVGGGYHGKSTLLEALQSGIYNHIPGDGRENVVTRQDAVKVRAEDGRSVSGTDISSFIQNLPTGQDTTEFDTENASGSTSQAAAIAEALEAGSRLIMIDEDTAATNFMIRDRRMQELVQEQDEPITPFVARIAELYQTASISTILVMGGSGAFFDKAHTVIGMRQFEPEDLTANAHAVAKQYPDDVLLASNSPWQPPRARLPVADSIDPSRGRRDVKTRSRALRAIGFGSEEIELDAVEQLVETAQLNAIAAALVEGRSWFARNNGTISEWLDSIEAGMINSGPESLARRKEGDFASFRRFELVAALNRLRSLRVSRT